MIAAADGPDAPESDRPPAEPLEAGRIENVFRLSPRLYSGGQPEGERDFTALRDLGIRTVISVDGARPDVEAARKAGLRYVHLPVGYDGVPRDRAVQLVKAVRESPGPVFVHCHHGKHRGPAAAALCGLAGEGWDRERARSWLAQAGTDPKYKGLFASVDRFVPPSAGELAQLTGVALPESADVPALVDAMVAIDAIADRLKEAERAAFRPAPARTALDPPHDALLLAEQFRELLRSPEATAKGGDFMRLLRDAERSATALEAAFETAPPGARRDELARAYRSVAGQCTACHARFRDRRPAR